jgi:L-alanine-DL-glutamate epimerase-like enolase superfamily enzyme
MLRTEDFQKVRLAFANAREALGGEIDIMAHCHNELDLPSAIGVARAVAPVNPYWLEDPLQVAYSDSWKTLHASAGVPLLTGEKLELPQQFLPFLQNQAIDMLHVDLAFIGGITGARRVADLARIYRLPIVCHNIGTLVLMMASAHFGAAIHDFIASENVLGQGYYVETMAAGASPVVKAGFLLVPGEPGLGADLNPEVVRANLAPGEPWWN